MPRDNLLNSACLELFEFIKRENLKPLIVHLVETCRPKLQEITYVDTFQTLILRYDQMQGFNPDADTTLFSNDGITTPNRTPITNGNRWSSSLKDTDAAEEAYFNTSDDEDDENSPRSKKQRPTRDTTMTNGVTSSPMLKSLVDYPDDEDDADMMDTRPAESTSPLNTPATSTTSEAPRLSPSPMLQTPPPESLSAKRRREEEDEDELGKLTTTSKRRNSAGSVSSVGSNGSNTLKRKKGGFLAKRDANEASTGDVKVKKIQISLGGKDSSDQSLKEDDAG